MDLHKHSQTVPLKIKIICSILIWLPILLPFFTIHYFPYATIISNIIILVYILITHLLTYVTCFSVFLKQQNIIHEFLNSKKWNDRRKHMKRQKDILHMVIIPIYKENFHTVENTLKSLAKQNVPMIIGFGVEEREKNSDIRYNNIIEKYSKDFIKIIKTIHPMNLNNEVAGKGSNCNYCIRQLVKFYEENNLNLKDFYKHVMVTSCDCDSIWSNDYFLYLNYLCTRNNLNRFDRIVYVPNITNYRQFPSSHVLTNWMSILRSIGTHGHFRFLGYVRAFVSEYHIPLELLKRIDFWDGEIVQEDIHMYNKLLILDEPFLIFQQTYLPCDNQTPTNVNSFLDTFLMLWNQTLRWNVFIYELYYLFYELLLNIFNIQRYENFRTKSSKILIQILNNYENLFFFGMCPIANNIFWLCYSYLSNEHGLDTIVDYLLHTIQPRFIFIQIILGLLYASFSLNIISKNTNHIPYHGIKYVLFLFGFIFLPFLFFLFQAINLTCGWIRTLKNTQTHSESTPKISSQ